MYCAYDCMGHLWLYHRQKNVQIPVYSLYTLADGRSKNPEDSTIANKEQNLHTTEKCVMGCTKLYRPVEVTVTWYLHLQTTIKSPPHCKRLIARMTPSWPHFGQTNDRSTSILSIRPTLRTPIWADISWLLYGKWWKRQKRTKNRLTIADFQTHSSSTMTRRDWKIFPASYLRSAPHLQVATSYRPQVDNRDTRGSEHMAGQSKRTQTERRLGLLGLLFNVSLFDTMLNLFCWECE